jgi:hypothetical protein
MKAGPRSLSWLRRKCGEGGMNGGLAGGRDRSADFVPVQWDGRWCCVCMRPERWDSKLWVSVFLQVGSCQMCGEPKEALWHGAAYVTLADEQARVVGWIGSGRRDF